MAVFNLNDLDFNRWAMGPTNFSSFFKCGVDERTIRRIKYDHDQDRINLIVGMKFVYMAVFNLNDLDFNRRASLWGPQISPNFKMWSLIYQ